MILGALGSLLIILAGLFDFVKGALFLVLGNAHEGFGNWVHSLLFVFLGVVLAAFSFYGRRAGSDRALTAGIVLILVSVLGLALLGFAGEVLALLGAILVLIGGVLFVVEGR